MERDHEHPPVRQDRELDVPPPAAAVAPAVDRDMSTFVADLVRRALARQP